MIPEDAKVLYDTYLSCGWHPQIKIYEDDYKEQEEGGRRKKEKDLYLSLNMRARSKDSVQVCEAHEVILMIRKMKEEDLQQCGEIYAKAFPIEYWGIDWNPDNAKEYLLDYYEQKKFVGYVFEEDDAVIGCIFALCKISGSKKEIYINEMAVLPERQGQGIGRQLLKTLLDYSRESGYAGVVLYTSEYAPASKFYEKNGFKLSQGIICMYCE